MADRAKLRQIVQDLVRLSQIGSDRTRLGIVFVWPDCIGPDLVGLGQVELGWLRLPRWAGPLWCGVLWGTGVGVGVRVRFGASHDISTPLQSRTAFA